MKAQVRDAVAQPVALDAVPFASACDQRKLMEANRIVAKVSSSTKLDL